VVRQHSNHHGVLSFTIHRAGLAPVPVVALYSPPRSSVLNQAPRSFSTVVMSVAASEAMRLLSEYGSIAVVGDFNWRLGPAFNGQQRLTDDMHAPVDQRHGWAERWHTNTGLCPLYGNTADHRERCTSMLGLSEAQGTAAPDGISVDPNSLHQRWIIPLDPLPFGALSPHAGGVHRPIGALMWSPPLPTPNPTPNPSQPVKHGPAPPQLPHYDSDIFHGPIHERILSVLSGHAAAADGGGDIDAILANVAVDVRDLQAEYLNERDHADANAAVARRRLRLQQGCRRPTPPHRTVQGHSSTPEVSAAAAACRAKFAQLKQARRQSHDPTVLAALQAESRALANKRDALIKRMLAKRHHQLAARLAHMYVRRPHKFFIELRKLVPRTPGERDTGTDIPPNPTAEATEAAFTDHFTTLATESRPEPSMLQPGSPWDQFIPRAFVSGSNAALLAPFTAEDIHRAVYPTHKLAGGRTCPPGMPCCVCDNHDAHLSTSEWRSPFHKHPEYKPRVYTSKALGLDGLFAETFRWSCPAHPDDRFDYRIQVCGHLAVLFNCLLARGTVPDDAQFRDCVLTPVHKKGPKTDPTNYRGICVSGLLGKTFGALLAARISHWAHVNCIISPEQVGFTAHHGCDYHIATLLELLRLRLRHHLASALAFVDYKSAFDNVSLSVAWHVFDRMCMPDHLIGLLRHWDEGIRIHVRVNGVLSPPSPQTKGFPQGGVLSPLGFNLVLEPLLRYLKRRLHTHGVTHSVGGVTLVLCVLAYADDIVLICPNRELLRDLGEDVRVWCEAFGMTMGMGNGKTMAMYVPAPPPRSLPGKPAPVSPPVVPADQLPPLDIGGGLLIPWTDVYRYLGYHLRSDLSDEDALSKASANMERALNSLFPYDRTIRALPVARQLQLLRTIALGCINFLLPFVDGVHLVSVQSTLGSLDAKVRSAVGDIYGLPTSTPSPYLHSVASIPSLVSVAVSSRWRLLWSIRTHPSRNMPLNFRPIACTLMELLEADHNANAGSAAWSRVSRHHANWYTTTVATWTDAQAHPWDTNMGTIASFTPTHPWEVSPQASRLQRAYEFSRWLRTMATSDSNGVYPGQVMHRRPISISPTATYLHLFFVQHMARRMPGTIPRQCAMSMQAPGCSGSVIGHALVPRAHAQIIALARLGTLGTSVFPLAPSGDVLQAMWRQARPSAGAAPAAAPAILASLGCTLCNHHLSQQWEHPGDIEVPDVWHMAVNCGHPRLVAWRRRYQLNLVKFIDVLVAAVLRACTPKDLRHDGVHGEARFRTHRQNMFTAVRTSVLATRASLANVATGALWTGHSAQWLQFMMLVALPFPYGVQSAGTTIPDALRDLTCNLAKLFDIVTLSNSEVRPVCTLWATWSARHLLELQRVCNRCRAVAAGLPHGH